LGQLKYFLEIKITPSQKKAFYISQKILDLLKEIGKLRYNKPVKTSIEINIKLNTEEDESLKDNSHFQGFVKKIIYLTVTRSDLSFIVSKIS
jgi:hypothetical protein